MSKIYSYVLRYDDGAAPNPFWGFCTLTICKPVIRRKASIGDWVIGLGSAAAVCNDQKTHNLSGQLVYAMKISHKLTLADYDKFCKENIPNKIPQDYTNDWKLRTGDCIYDYSNIETPKIRNGGVHTLANQARDLSGVNALIADHFYYFGERPIYIPLELSSLIKKNQGHKIIDNVDLLSKFEAWITKYDRNRLYADPQMRFKFDQASENELISTCSKNHLEEPEEDEEESIC